MVGREKHGESSPKHGREAIRRYTEAEIIDAIHRWVAIYGAPPTSADWDRARTLRQGNQTRLARLNDNSWPTTRMVRCSFGTFNSAIIRAGHIPRPVPSRLAGRFASPDEVLLAIQAWAARYGEPPTMADWDPYRARRQGQEWRVTRYEEGDWPSTRSICRHFGNIEQCGPRGGSCTSGAKPTLRPQHEGTQAATTDGDTAAKRRPDLGTLPPRYAGSSRVLSQLSERRDDSSRVSDSVGRSGSQLG